MLESPTIEERVARLEREMAELKLRAQPQETVREWLGRVGGRLRDYPEFEEVIRLGREIRQNYQSDADV